MTKSFEMPVNSTCGKMGRPIETTWQDPSVLDLSCKKISLRNMQSEFGLNFSVSPLRGSVVPEIHQETNNNNNNNNNNKQINSYEKSQIEKIQQNQVYQQRYVDEALHFSSSNHERKSPENRSYIMTPPSEADSPSKTRFQPIFDHTNFQGSEIQKQVSYPMQPMRLPMPTPVSVPSSMPTPVSVPSSMPTPVSVPSPMPTFIPQSCSSPAPQAQVSCSSTVPEVSNISATSEETRRAQRPFKAYPKDPLTISFGPDMIFDQDLKKAYTDFRSRMLESVRRTNEGTNIKMRRVSKSPNLPPNAADEKDSAYWERRRKNNEAAKRSRDARRAKEDEIAIRAAFLEQEYIRLKYENAMLRDENTKIKCMLCQGINPMTVDTAIRI